MRKHLLFLALALSCICLASCQRITTAEIETGDVTGQSKEVQFVIGGITEEYSTRSTVQSLNLTDIWVWEGTTLLKHQTSTDSDFGLPVVTLPFGAHDLTFVASASEGQTLTSGVWSCTKQKEVYAKQMAVTVSANSSKSRQVALTRRSSKVMFTTTDVIPTTVSKVYIKVATCKSLTAALAGTDAYNYEATVNIASKQGSTYTNFINTLTTSATDEEDCDLLIRWLSADDAVLYEFSRTIKVKPNRATNLTGNYFDTEGSSTNTISVSTDWDTQLDVPLNGESE